MALPLPPPDSAKTTAGMRPDLRYHKTYLPCIPAAAAHEATTTGSATETPVSSTTETPVYSSTTETPFSSATETPVYSSTTETPVYATETPVYSSARVSVSPRRVITAIAKRRSPTISFLEKREQEVLSSSDTETQDKQRQRRESVGSELMDRRTIQFQSIT